MSDSLRDQLIAAGFDAPKKEARKKPKAGNAGPDKGSKSKQSGRKTNRNHGKAKTQDESAARGRSRGNRGGTRGLENGRKGTGAQSKSGPETDPQQLARIEERKKLKAKIKTLIDENKTETWKGEAVYRYLVDKKIRELYVSEELHPKLTAREVAITRYNGETFIVPRDTGRAIKEINPQWSVFNLEEEESSTEQDTVEGEYADYQVPDDLQW